MKKLKLSNVFVLVCFFMLCLNLRAQKQPRLSGFKSYVPTLESYQEQIAGKIESEYIGIGLNIGNKTHIVDWTLRVRALGDYVNQSNPGSSVAPQFTSLQFSSVNRNAMAPANTAPVRLSTSETVLLFGTLPLDSQTSGGYLQYKFDIIIQGGNHLLVANGNYRVSLEFLLYDANNNLLDSFVLNNVGFQIQTGNYGSNTLILQNSANNITFVFDDLSDFQNGLSRSKPLGLKVEYNGPYDIIVKANSNVLTSTTTSSTIPVSAIHLEITQTQENLPNLTIAPSFSLTAAETVAVRNPSRNYLYADVEYNLRYFIPQNETRNILGSSGTYTTQIFFIAIPQ